MEYDRNLRLMVVYDPNSRDSIAMADAIDPFGDIERIEVDEVRHLLPGVRATPCVGVIMWASDLQGVVSNVEDLEAYLRSEAEIKESAHISQRYVPDDVAYAQPRVLFEQWSGEGVAYVAGDVRLYNGEIYRCLTTHTSQADWTPDTAVSLWVRIADPNEEWPEWVQPLGAHDAYASGAKVSHNDKHWTSDMDANTYEPGVYGWSEVS